MNKYGEVAVSAVILAVGAVLFVAAQYIDTGAAMSKGGDFMPKVATTLLLVLAAAQFVSSMPQTRTQQPDDASAAQSEENGQNYRAFYLNILLLVGYVLLMQPVGFLLSTAVYITLQMYLYAPKERKYLYLSPAVGIVSSVAIYYAFVSGFELLLPAGILG